MPETFQGTNRATIKDVSRVAGVSVGTVSNVLNSPEIVAPGTRERVSGVIAELGYLPNRAARALQQQRTFSIGYRMPQSGTEAFALDAFLHRMAERAGRADLDIVLFTPKEGQDEVEAYQEMVGRGAVDGFVISGTGHGDERIGYLIAAGFPFVTFGRTDVSDRHPWVDIDGSRGVEIAVTHLASLGHRRIALIGWPEGSITGDERAAGYRLGLAEVGIPYRDALVVRAENGVGEGAEAMERLLGTAEPPTAVVTVQDLLALGAMHAIREAGLRVGSDVAVVGFDDTPSAAVALPPLSSVRQPMEQVGELVVEILMRALGDDGSAVPSSAMVAPELVVRASSDPGGRQAA